jgi:hypothetical protein
LGASFSNEFKEARIGSSYLCPRRGRSSSTKCSDQACIRFSTRTGGSSPTHGTSNTYARFILE